MVNPNLLKMAERLGNDSLPVIERPKQTPITKQNSNRGFTYPDLPDESFIFSYDGPHGDFFQELIVKINQTYAGTSAEIPLGTSGETQGHLVKRMGMISTIARDTNLRSANLWPITAAQSEYLLQADRLTNPKSNWEDFGVVLYDRSVNGENSKEAQALYESLQSYRQDLGLSPSDLEARLVIINPGAEVDSNLSEGVRPIIIPGVTQVYQHEALNKVGEDYNFEGYGLSGGLPLLNQLNGSGSRVLYMPDETSDIGLRVLYRFRNLDLGAWGGDLAYSGEGGRVNFAPQAQAL